MKKLILLFVLSISIMTIKAQTDTTITFINDITEGIIATTLNQSDFFTVDTLGFDIEADASNWQYKYWIETKRTQINPSTERVRLIQIRVNDQGIVQKRFVIIKYKNELIIKRKIK